MIRLAAMKSPVRQCPTVLTAHVRPPSPIRAAKREAQAFPLTPFGSSSGGWAVGRGSVSRVGWHITWQDPVAIGLVITIVAGLWFWRRLRRKRGARSRVSVAGLRLSRRDREP